MLGRKDFTADEVAAAQAAVQRALTAFADAGAPAALEEVFFADALLALDRRFVHRVRMVTGKDGTPLNEVELLVTALVHHDGVLTLDNVIRYDAERAVLGLRAGERVALTAESFGRLAQAFFAELEEKYRP
jgi:hypothetical protein